MAVPSSAVLTDGRRLEQLSAALQGQRVNQPMTGPSPRSASPSQSPMYPTVKPTDDLDEAPAPAGKASKCVIR